MAKKRKESSPSRGTRKPKGKPRARAKKSVDRASRGSPKRALPSKKRRASRKKALAAKRPKRKRVRTPVQVRSRGKKPAQKPAKNRKVGGSVKKAPAAKRKPAKARKPLDLRVVKGKTTGKLGPSGRKRKPRPSLKSLDLRGKTREQMIRAMYRQIDKLNKERIVEERAEKKQKVTRRRVRATLEKTREWLQVVSARAECLGRATRFGQAVNRDGTSDLQLVIGEWGEGPYRDALFSLFTDLQDSLPRIENGVRIRPAIRIRPADPDNVRFKYLPNVGNMKAINYNYTLPRNLWATLRKVVSDVDRFTAGEGYKLVQVVLDARFDPRWIE